MRGRPFAAAAALLLAAMAGCPSLARWRGGERVVLAVQTGLTDGPTIHRQEVIDTGIPALHNLTGHPVRLLWVRWVHQPTAAHIVSV